MSAPQSWLGEDTEKTGGHRNVSTNAQKCSKSLVLLFFVFCLEDWFGLGAGERYTTLRMHVYNAVKRMTITG